MDEPRATTEYQLAALRREIQELRERLARMEAAQAASSISPYRAHSHAETFFDDKWTPAARK